jgi:urease subunit alpha
MFGAYSAAGAASGLTFVCRAALAGGLEGRLRALGVTRRLTACANPRGRLKKDMIFNSLTPHLEVDPQTYEVRADGQLLICEPARVLPMAQRYFLF